MVVFQPPAGCCGQPILDGSMGVRMCGQEVPEWLDCSMWACRGGLLVGGRFVMINLYLMVIVV
jgi:hypothetical protein